MKNKQLGVTPERYNIKCLRIKLSYFQKVYEAHTFYQNKVAQRYKIKCATFVENYNKSKGGNCRLCREMHMKHTESVLLAVIIALHIQDRHCYH